MSWPATDKELTRFGKKLVADSAKMLTGFELAYGEVTVTAQTPQIVRVLRATTSTASASYSGRARGSPT